MDAGNWITLAGVAAAWLVPLANTWLKDWLERRKTNKELEQPQYKAGRFVSLFGNRFTSLLISILSLSTSLILLIYELSDTAPITRNTIFNIALYTSGIFSQLLLILINIIVDGMNKTDSLIINRIRDGQKEFLSLSSKQVDALEQIITITNLSLNTNKEHTGNRDDSIC